MGPSSDPALVARARVPQTEAELVGRALCGAWGCPSHPQHAAGRGAQRQANEEMNKRTNAHTGGDFLCNAGFKAYSCLLRSVLTAEWEQFPLIPRHQPNVHFSNRPQRYKMMDLAGTINHPGKQHLNPKDRAADKRGILYEKHGC